MPNEDVTPIRQQYLEIKRDYPNTILFFRLGDFYETFDEDAQTVSRELDIVLTSRPIGKGQRAPSQAFRIMLLRTTSRVSSKKAIILPFANRSAMNPSKKSFHAKLSAW